MADDLEADVQPAIGGDQGNEVQPPHSKGPQVVMGAASGDSQKASKRQSPARKETGAVLPPPPPPPRSKLPQPRPMPEIAPARSGIGSANTRWRGALPAIVAAAGGSEKEVASFRGSAVTDENTESLVGTEEVDEPDNTVTRSAPSWLLSLVVHLIVLLVLALVSSPAGRGLTNLVLEIGFAEEQAEDAVDLELFSNDSIAELVTDADSTEDTLVEMDLPDVFETVQPADEEIIQPDMIGDQPIEFSQPMFGGRTGAMRRALMAMYGATDETREAVALGLQWLKRQQNKSGYWSLRGPYENGGFSENRTAATAMALLAFAGDGNTHLSGEYKDEVSKGLKYLVGKQDRSGFMSRDARGNQATYAQAQATILLCELYGMTKDSWLRAYAQRAIDYAMAAQSTGGGWRYRPGEAGDTSVTGWYVMAVQSAMSAGLDVNDSKVRLISDYLDAASHYNGAGYSYQPRSGEPTPTMTAEGLLCRQYLGWPKGHPPMTDGINMLRVDAPFDPDRRNVYYWYYATQVFHHYGGSNWTEWNDEMKVELPRLQITDGKERGSWAPQRDQWAMAGRLYTTCLSIYCLEVYYRHLPLYKNQ